MKETEKSLARNTEVNNALDVGDKTREKIEKIQTFDLSYSLGKNYLKDDGTQNYFNFNQCEINNEEKEIKREHGRNRYRNISKLSRKIEKMYL